MTDPNDFDRLHPQTAPTQQPTQPITPTMPAQPQGPQQSPDHRRKRPAWVVPTIIAAIAAVVVIALILVFTNLNKPATTDNATTGTSSAESSAPAHSPGIAADDSAGGDGNTSTQAPADASIESLAAITDTIESDMQASVKSIKDKLAETEGKLGDTYDSYKNNMGALDDWYTYLEEESHRLYVKIGRQHRQVLADLVRPGAGQQVPGRRRPVRGLLRRRIRRHAGRLVRRDLRRHPRRRLRQVLRRRAR
ncbi:hypothetical protein [Bifidobacterium cuniculi]|uniref:hypothetical protein n=1 Tax=Bifidobacterium cuniculi TaxID=1688 RepID=UPI0012E0AFD7|nr:hypothetical protein [Bifidobacterium cuniculi]